MRRRLRTLLERGGRELQRRSLDVLGRAMAAAGALPLAPSGAWIFGGSVGAHYGDNSAALHEHVRRLHPDHSAWWAINRDSPDLGLAADHGPVLFRDDPRTFAAVHDADVAVISHGIHDVPGADRARGPLLVRLGHGLTALKRTKVPPLRRARAFHEQWGLVPVASEFERDIKLSWGIPEDRLVVTGLCRFDTLMAKRARRRPDASRTILFMPTWRDWIAPTSNVDEVGFFRAIVTLLQDADLHRHLVREDLHLEVYLHRLLHPHVASLAQKELGPRVRVLNPAADVQNHLASSSALVTDYSSVCWDALYAGVPTVFFHFDVKEYEAHRGAHIDLNGELPGLRATRAGEVVEALSSLHQSGYALPAESHRWRSRAFAFEDTGNCERVYQAIQARRGVK